MPMILNNIFQVPIFTRELEIDNKSLAKFCMSEYYKNEGEIKSNVGGWHSNDFTEKNDSHTPLIKNLWPNIKLNSKQFGKELNLNVKGKLGNLWVNINGYKDSNAIHLHPGCLISGAYYIKTHKNCGDITFYHPSHLQMSHNWLRDEPDEYNSYNSATWWYPSTEGTLYLFPSWLEHSVKPNLNKREKRISVSFNVS
tara:strand:+ start:528 stop:1118 length:591 start_codon:yes stop_codon:yes gene_type:complete